MAIDTNALTGISVVSAEDALVALFEGTGIECSVGSTIRELVIRPMAVLQAAREQADTDVLNSLNLNQIASGAVEGTTAVVDALAATFRTTRASNIASTGSIFLRLRRSEIIYINATYQFRIGALPLNRSKIYVGVPSITGYTSTAEVEYVPILQTGSEYYIVVPVTASGGNTFAVGTAVSFTGDAGNVYEAFVFSPITGGRSSESNQELAQRVLNGVPPGVLSTPLQLRGAFMSSFGIPPSRVSVYGCGNASVRRGVDSFTGLPMAGYTDVIVAPLGGCGKSVVTMAVTKGDGDTYTGSLTSEQAAGVYRVVSIIMNGIPIDNENVTVTRGADTTYHKLTDSRYTAFQTLDISFEDTGTFTAPLSAQLVLSKAHNIKALQTYVDASDRRAPGQDTLVRAPSPCFISVDLTVQNTTMSVSELKELISAYINFLPVGKGSLTAQDLMDSLPSGAKMVFPVRITGNFDLQESTRTIHSTSGNLSCPDWPSSLGGITAEETVFYTTPGDIKVKVL